MTAGPADAADAALGELLDRLKSLRYRFVTPTPATHERVVARPGRERARDLRDALGWNLPFAPGLLGPALEGLLDRAGALERKEGLLRSRLRAASLGDWLLLHSGFPTTQRNAVFFGPDSYRFAALIRAETSNLRLSPGAAIVDIGGGTGVGALVAADAFPAAAVTMTEINPAALRLARANIAAAGADIRLVGGADLAGIAGEIDLVVANPPYIADEAGRAYRDGGAGRGAAVPLDMALMAAARLAPGGRIVLYTGSAIVGGEDGLRDALALAARAHGLTLRYSELDPDVFGEELERPAYAEVERIALVAAILDRPG